MYQPNDKYNSDHNNFQKGEKKEEEWLETWSKKWFVGFQVIIHWLKHFLWCLKFVV